MQKIIPNEAIEFIDASTGKVIQNLLVVPFYSSFDGVAVAPEGPSRGTERGYLAAPFIYRAGEPFSLTQPKSTGVFWGPVYTGKTIELKGVFVLAQDYRMQSFTDLWTTAKQKRRVQLKRISPQESSRELQTALAILEKDTIMTRDERSFWQLDSSAPAGVRLNQRERQVVLSFLREALKELRERQ